MTMMFRLAWLETKLLLREPITLVFTLGLPLVMEFVMGGVFGNTAQAGFYRGVGAMNYYLPAYAVLVTAALGLIALPTHLATYRERGVLRRFEASSIPRWSLFGAQTLVTIGLGAAGAALVVTAGRLSYDTSSPASPTLVLAAFLLSAVTFAALGVLLGVAMPTARAAQGIGVMLWFVMLILGGAGPPPEVLSGAMRAIAAATPLSHAVVLIQDPWLGFGWNWGQTAIVAAWLAVAAALAAAVVRVRSTR